MYTNQLESLSKNIKSVGICRNVCLRGGQRFTFCHTYKCGLCCECQSRTVQFSLISWKWKKEKCRFESMDVNHQKWCSLTSALHPLPCKPVCDCRGKLVSQSLSGRTRTMWLFNKHHKCSLNVSVPLAKLMSKAKIRTWFEQKRVNLNCASSWGGDSLMQPLLKTQV